MNAFKSFVRLLKWAKFLYLLDVKIDFLKAKSYE